MQSLVHRLMQQKYVICTKKNLNKLTLLSCPRKKRVAMSFGQKGSKAQFGIHIFTYLWANGLLARHWGGGQQPGLKLQLLHLDKIHARQNQSVFTWPYKQPINIFILQFPECSKYIDCYYINENSVIDYKRN